jgi:predicted DNA-binding transcriptional regulator YafY
VKAALRKLVRALPETFRSDAEAASAAVVIDPADWGRSSKDRPPPQHLEAVQRAVIEGRQVTLGYVARDQAPSTRVVHPLGLATKNRAWYLVADTVAGLRTFRVDRMTSVAPTGDAVVRPDGFDLAAAWKLITAEVDAKRVPVRARGSAAIEIVGLLRMMFGTSVSIGPTDAAGRVEIEVAGASVEALAGELAGLGSGVEVREPTEVRERLGTIGAELVATYAAR